MMNQQTFWTLSLSLQTILVLAILFGGAKWIGATNQILKTLSKAVEKLTRDFEEHSRSDAEELRELDVRLAKIGAHPRKERA